MPRSRGQLRRLRWYACLGGAGLLGVVALSLFGSTGAHAASPQVNFTGIASADGFDVTVSNPSIPLNLVVEGAGPTAQASLSSLQESDGFASFPYPGQDVVSLPGLLSGAFLAGAPVPAYPLYTQTSYGDPATSANFPGISLTSQSQLSECHATAVVGTAGIGFTADAQVDQASDSSVTAVSSAKFNGIQLGPLLSLSGVVSTASEVLQPDGTFKSSSSLSIADISIPGLALTIPKSTPSSVGIPIPIPGLPQLPRPTLPVIPIPLGGTTLLAPQIGLDNGQFTLTLPIGTGKQTFALPAQAIFDYLKVAGINITYEAAQTTPTSVISPALTFSTVLPAPPPNNYFNGPTPVNITIGLSKASIQGSVVPTPPAASSGLGTLGPSSTSGSDIPAFSSSSSSPSFTSPSSFGNGLSPTSDTTPSTSGSGPIQAVSSPPVYVARRSLISSIFDLYFVLIAVALVGTWASTFLRYVGVRTLWKS
jgi:hypothetical protein